MKRQLIAALLALNVVAMAVPTTALAGDVTETQTAEETTEVEAQAADEAEEVVSAQSTADELAKERGERYNEAADTATREGMTFDSVPSAAAKETAILTQLEKDLRAADQIGKMRELCDQAIDDIKGLLDDDTCTDILNDIENEFTVTLAGNDDASYYADTFDGTRPASEHKNPSFEDLDGDNNTVDAVSIRAIVNYYKTKLPTEAVTKGRAKGYSGFIKDSIKAAGYKTRGELKAEYISRINGYKLEDYAREDYKSATQKDLATELEDAVKAINNNTPTSEADLLQLLNDYVAVWTDNDQADLYRTDKNVPKGVAELKEDKLKNLADHMTKELQNNTYTDNQRKRVNDYKVKYTKLIQDALKKADINSLYAEAISKIDAVIKKDTSEANVNALMSQIKAIGKLDASNYVSKRPAIQAAVDAYAKLEEGTVGKTKIDTESALKTDPNANAVEPGGQPDLADGHYSYKKVLQNAKDRYDDLTILQLTEKYKKLTLDLTTINTDNYQQYQAEFESAEAMLKTLFDAKKLAGDYDSTAFTQAKAQADTAYRNAKDFMIKAAATDFEKLKDTLAHVLDKDDDVHVTEANVQDVMKAIKAYEILDKFAASDYDRVIDPSNLTEKGTRVEKVYREGKADYAELQKQLKEYQDAQEKAEARVNLEKATVSLEYETKEYTGEEIRPVVTVTNAEGEVVSSDNYNVSYRNNVNVGEVQVIVVATGNTYKGSNDKKTFKITPKTITSANTKVTVEDLYYRSGKARNAVPAVVVDGKEIARNTDYKVAYKNNVNVGKATVVITGTDNYTGSVSASYVIKPEKATIKSLKAGKKKITVKAVQEKGAKYQFAYKVKGTSKYKTVTTNNVTKTINGLKSKKTYSVKVRAYKTINGQKYLGNWSNVKTVKVK